MEERQCRRHTEPQCLQLTAPKMSFRAPSILLIPPPSPPQSARCPPTHPTCAGHVQSSCLSLAPLQGGNSLVLSAISCRSHCSSAPLHPEPEIALEFPCTMKSTSRIEVNAVIYLFIFFLKSYLVLNCFSIRLCTRVLSGVSRAYAHSRKESFILPAIIDN